jgi:DNA-directed RNA polymerase sigma subunit (sigma70/sigma32)
MLYTLEPRTEKIIRMITGFGEKTRYTVEEIADVFGLSADLILAIIRAAKAELLCPERAAQLPEGFGKRADGVLSVVEAVRLPLATNW